MRLKLLRVAFVALVIVSVELLYTSGQGFGWFSNRFRSPLNRPSPSQSSVVIAKYWAEWAAIIYKARPQVPAIKLSSIAPNVDLPDAPVGRRKPPLSRISLSSGEILDLQSSHVQMKRALEARDLGIEAARLYKGTGVVTVGGGEYFGPAIVGISMLRQTGSTIPVEVFVENEAEYESTVCELVLPNLNAKCLVIADFLGPTYKSGQSKDGPGPKFKVTHYQLKSLAMLFSSFEQFLYLDSDSIPLVNPETELFTTEPYLATGLVGWPDFWVGTEAPEFWSVAGLDAYPSNLPMASGETAQLLVNKSRHLDTLLLATYYNVYGPDWYYPLLSQGALGQGDKETFYSAAIVLNQSQYRVQSRPRAVGRHDSFRFKGSGMVQHHPGDDYARANSPSKEQVPAGNGSENAIRPAFLHANTPKMNAGHLVDEGDLVEERNKTHHLRLWGPAEDQISMFGEDLEHRVWKILVKVGCELADVLREWQKRKDMCQHVVDHFNEVFS